jgi:hypothetical protein
MADASATFDPQLIFDTLSAAAVDYVLIGGLAVQTHGHTRMTNDVDLIPAPDPENLQRLAQALRELDARVVNPGAEDTAIDAAMLPRATIWQFATPHGGIDVLHDAPGAAPYDELAERAIAIELGGATIRVVSLDDLVRMKLARNRRVDREDVAALTDPLD